MRNKNNHCPNILFMFGAAILGLTLICPINAKAGVVEPSGG